MNLDAAAQPAQQAAARVAPKLVPSVVGRGSDAEAGSRGQYRIAKCDDR
jgi:hypothetical protein